MLSLQALLFGTTILGVVFGDHALEGASHKAAQPYSGWDFDVIQLSDSMGEPQVALLHMLRLIGQALKYTWRVQSPALRPGNPMFL